MVHAVRLRHVTGPTQLRPQSPTLHHRVLLRRQRNSSWETLQVKKHVVNQNLLANKTFLKQNCGDEPEMGKCKCLGC